MAGENSILGQTVTVSMDRPMGTCHPKHKDIYYPVNYGYISGIIGGDGEEQDAYVLGVDEPLQEFTGVVIAIIHRLNDVEDKWVVAPEGVKFTEEEIAEQVKFQEQYFKTEIVMAEIANEKLIDLTEEQSEYINEQLHLYDKEYRILKLLGKGKGGYSYLVADGEKQYVLKQIHHEPCSYYQFGNKMESELNDYKRLTDIGIRMPKLLEYDMAQERILKEYIDGETVFELVRQDKMQECYVAQMREMCLLLYAAGINIDYFPTNFVVQNGELFYIDFECNNYMEEWNFENWGIKYWSKTPEFLQYLEEHYHG